MATHSSILAWRIPWTEEPGGLQSMDSQRIGRDEQLTHIHIHIYRITSRILNACTIYKSGTFQRFNCGHSISTSRSICLTVAADDDSDMMAPVGWILPSSSPVHVCLKFQDVTLFGNRVTADVIIFLKMRSYRIRVNPKSNDGLLIRRGKKGQTRGWCHVKIEEETG